MTMKDIKTELIGRFEETLLFARLDSLLTNIREKLPVPVSRRILALTEANLSTANYMYENYNGMLARLDAADEQYEKDIAELQSRINGLIKGHATLQKKISEKAQANHILAKDNELLKKKISALETTIKGLTHD